MSYPFNFFCFEFMVGNGFISKPGGLSFITLGVSNWHPRFELRLSLFGGV